MTTTEKKKTTKIYVKLINEGLNVWKPVSGVAIEEYFLLLEDDYESDEVWEFPPGAVVTVEERKFKSEIKLVATSLKRL